MQIPTPSMNLSILSDKDVLANLEKYVKSERKIMHIVLCYIAEVEKRKLFLTKGYDSTYKFLTQSLGYAEDAAYDRMQAARVLTKVPSVTHKLETGTINLTQLVKISQCLKQEKKLGHTITQKQTEDLITKIENKTNFETAKVLAVELNHVPKQHQKITPQSDNSIRIEMSFSKEEFDLIKEAQSLYSHAVTDNYIAALMNYLVKKAIDHKKGRNPQPSSNKQGTLKTISKESPQKENPKERQPKIKSKNKPATQSFSLKRGPKRKYLSRRIRRAVLAKAGGCCQHIHPETKIRCNSKFQLQIDHIIPLAKGGTDDVENLRVLCGVHNRYEALKWGLHRPSHLEGSSATNENSQFFSRKE